MIEGEAKSLLIVSKLQRDVTEDTDRSFIRVSREGEGEFQQVVGLEESGNVMLDHRGLSSVKIQGLTVQTYCDQPVDFVESTKDFFTGIESARGVKSSRNRHSLRRFPGKMAAKIDRNYDASGDRTCLGSRGWG